MRQLFSWIWIILSLSLLLLFVPSEVQAVDSSGVPLSEVTQLAVSYTSSCALSNEGVVRCWGNISRNNQTQLNPFPQVMDFGDNQLSLIAVRGQGTLCGVNQVNEVVCGTGEAYTRVEVSFEEKVAELAFNETSTYCARTSSGSVKCWGGNIKGLLGAGTADNSDVPLQVVGFESGSLSVSIGRGAACAVSSAGRVFCWGDNRYYALGKDTSELEESNIPVEIPNLRDIVQVSSSDYYTCARDKHGDVWCWGWNQEGVLGNGTNQNSISPVKVIDLGSPAISVQTARSHVCALLENGTVKCWGSTWYYVPGAGDSVYKPALIDGLSVPITQLEVSNEHACVINSVAQVQCWGTNTAKQLGYIPSDPYRTTIPNTVTLEETRPHASSGFNATLHGYSFPNANAQTSKNLFEQTYAPGSTDSLLAQEYYKDTYQSGCTWYGSCRAGEGGSGVCLGMTATSSLVFRNEIQVPVEIGSSQIHSIQKPPLVLLHWWFGMSQYWDKGAASDFIMLYHGRQSTLESVCEKQIAIQRSITQTRQIIQNSLNPLSSEYQPIVLALSGAPTSNDSCYMHSVVPTRWVQDNQKVIVTIYDPNVADKEFDAITFDLANGTWTADMTHNGWGIWHSGGGCKSDQNLYRNTVTVLSSRVFLERGRLIFDGNFDDTTCKDYPYDAFLYTPTLLSPYVNQERVQFIPDYGQAQGRGQGLFAFDSAQPLTVTTVLNQQDESLTIVKEGEMMIVASQGVTGTTEDLTVNLSDGSLEIARPGITASQQSSEPVLHAIKKVSADDTALELTRLQLSLEKTLSVAYGLQGVTVSSSQDQMYDLVATEMVDATTSVMTFTMPSLNSGAIHQIDVDFLADTVEVNIDQNGDGTTDSVVVVEPVGSPNQVFLPLIVR